MTDHESKYWAFLVHSDQDNRPHRSDGTETNHRCWGDWLHEALKNFPIPPEFVGQPNGRNEIIPERIEPIFRDESESLGDADLNAGVHQALVKSNCLIVVCSPRSATNLHVNEVVRQFKQLGRSRQILPIVIAGEPYAGDGQNPGGPSAEECFVPALRHPVTADGTIDTTRRAGRQIFVDARHGLDKREILIDDHRQAEADLEVAKVQLIALLLGVGFNGLWSREQQQHFFGLVESRHQVQEALGKAEIAGRQTHEAQNQLLSAENLPPDVQQQLQAAQKQVQAAWDQAHAVQEQLRETENRVRETQAQLEEARQRALASENKALAAENVARATQSQLEEVRNQPRETQNPPVQNEAVDPSARGDQEQILAAQRQVSEAQSEARAAQDQLHHFQDKVQQLQSQLDAARQHALTSESKLATAQNLAQATQHQFTEAGQQLRELQTLQSQLEASHRQARQEDQNKLTAAESQIQEFQKRVQATENQLETARHQIRTAQDQVLAAQQQAEATQGRIQEMERRTQDVLGQMKAARDEVQAGQNRNQQSRRVTKVLALLAVLALLSAALAASVALRQRKIAAQALARLDQATTGKFDPTTGRLESERIRQALQNIGGPEQIRNLDELAAWIPQSEIPGALAASTILLNDQQRSHFQKWLLIRLGWTDPQSAMTNASAIGGRIVNDEGAGDSNFYFQLAVLDNWLKTDLPAAFAWVCQLPEAAARERALSQMMPALAASNPQTTLARLNDLKPVPSEKVYRQLFQNWAEHNPVEAIQQRTQLPDHDQNHTILCAIMTEWMRQHPETALAWVTSQPESADKQAAVMTCLNELAKTNRPQALAWGMTLPESSQRHLLVAGLFNDWLWQDPLAARQFARQQPELSSDALSDLTTPWPLGDWFTVTNWIGSLNYPPAIAPAQKISAPALLLNPDIGRLLPPAVSSSPTNEPAQTGSDK